MHTSFRLFFVLLVIALVGLTTISCTFQVNTNPDYKFSQGDVSKYVFQTTQQGKVTIDGDTSDFNLKLVSTVSQKVQKVDEQGVATVDSSFDNIRLTVDGEDLPLPEFADTLVTYEVDRDGVIENVRGTNGLAGPLGERQFDPAQIFQFQGPSFREGVMRKGDKWQQTIAVPFPGTDPIKTTIDYTYLGTERLKGKVAAKVSFSFDAPLDIVYSEMDAAVRVVGKEQMEGTAFFSLDKGKAVKASGKGPLQLSIRMPSEGGGQDNERVKVDIGVDFNYELQE